MLSADETTSMKRLLMAPRALKTEGRSATRLMTTVAACIGVPRMVGLCIAHRTLVGLALAVNWFTFRSRIGLVAAAQAPGYHRQNWSDHTMVGPTRAGTNGD